MEVHTDKLFYAPLPNGLGRGFLLLLTLLITSCSTKQADYTNVIPADATQVVEVNLKSLADKAGLKDKENKETLQRLSDALKSGMNAATYQQVEAIVKDPAKSGVDVDAPFYLFNAPDFPTPMLVAKVKDEDDLRRLLETLEREQLCNAVTEADGYSFTQIDRQAVIAFTPTTLLFVPTAEKKAADQIPLLLKQPADKSIAGSTAFKKMQKQGGDISLLTSLTGFPKMYIHPRAADMAKSIDLKELKIIGNLSFEKGKVELTLESYTENADLIAELEKPAKCTMPIDNSFLKYLPKSTLALFSVGLNGEAFYNLLQENEEFRDEFSLSRAAELKELFNAFRGDLTVALLDVTMKGEPTVVAYVNVKNDTPVEALYEKRSDLGLRRGEEIVKLTDNDYLYKSRRRNLFFGIRDKQLYVTNDEMLYKNIGKAADPSVKSADFASTMKGNRFAAVVNAEAILDLPIVKVLAGFGGPEFSTYYALLGNIAYIEVLADEDDATLTLQLKDKDSNALKQAVAYIKQLVNLN